MLIVWQLPFAHWIYDLDYYSHGALVCILCMYLQVPLFGWLVGWPSFFICILLEINFAAMYPYLA